MQKVKHKNGKTFELKKDYGLIVVGYLLVNNKRVLSRNCFGNLEYDVKGNPIYKKSILNKKNIYG